MAAGLAPADFWDATPREFRAVVAGAAERDRRALRLQQAVAYSLAGLVGHAFHQPKKMPKFDKVFPDPAARGRPQTAEESIAALRLWTRGRKR